VDEELAFFLPDSDVQRDAAWTGGAGGTAGLFAALDNTPPAGVADASATDSSQIENAASDTDDVYVAGFPALSSEIPAGADLRHARLLTHLGRSGSTSRDMGFDLSMDTGGSWKGEQVIAAGAGAAGVFPSNWGPSPGVAERLTADISADGLALTEEPRVRFRKATATTDRVFSCYAGLYVSYVPAPPDVTPPVVTIDAITGQPSATEPCTQLGPGGLGDVIAIWEYTADEPIVSYEIVLVEDAADDRGDAITTFDAGGTAPVLSYGGTVEDTELEAFGPGVHICKLFVMDEAGNWSTAAASPTTEIEYVPPSAGGVGPRRLGGRGLRRLGL
jgi:hypothetical protein